MEFNKFEIYHNKELVSLEESNINGTDINSLAKNRIRLKIYGLLYKKENNSSKYNELLDTLAFTSHKFSYENNTEINYSNNNKFEICFSNIPKNDFKYDIQIKINIIFNDYFFKEDSLTYILPIDFRNELEEKEKEKGSILLTFLIIISIIVLLVFIFLYFKLKKKNKSFEGLLFPTSLSFSSLNSEEIMRENSKEKISGPNYVFI